MFNFRQIPPYFMWFFNKFKDLFSKSQLDNFERLVSGHVLADRKNIQEINAIYGDKDQSSLNRFVTTSEWDTKQANRIGVETAVNTLGRL